MRMGLPGGIEARKQAYAGVTLPDLIARYNDAERRRDMPEMLALLDIIRAAPKDVEGPETTVKDDIVAAAQPQPQPMMAPPVAGLNGAVTAMENQPPVLAADGGFMGRGDTDPVEMMAKGGPARFQFGGQGSVFGAYSPASLSLVDIERMAMMGDPEAQKELSKRMRANIPRVTLPTSTPLGVPPPAPTIGPAQVFPTQTSIVTGTGAVPATSVTPTLGAPQAFPGQNLPTKLGIPGVTPGTTPAGAAPVSPSVASPAMPPNAGPQPGGIRGFFNTAGRFVGNLGKATGVLSLIQPTEGNVGEEDMLQKMRWLQKNEGTLSAQDKKLARDMALQPRITMGQFMSRFAPGTTGEDGAPSGPSLDVRRSMAETPVSTSGAGLPAGFMDLIKPRDTNYFSTQRRGEIAKLEESGEIRKLEDIKKDFEKFRTEAKERGESDKAAAQASYKEDLLMSAALAAPQFLKGRGLGQATARFAETISPLAQRAMATRAATLKEATKLERDAADKFRLAQLDLDKAQRQQLLGNIDKDQALESQSLTRYASGVLDKYKADTTAATYLGYIDRIVAKGQMDQIESAFKERLPTLRQSQAFRDASYEMQQRMIDRLFLQVKNNVMNVRPSIRDVPGQ